VAASLTPNSPAGRFEYVIKTYWGKSYKGESLDGAVLDAFWVTTSLLGAHHLSTGPLTVVQHEPGSLSARFEASDIRVDRIQQRLERESDQVTASKGAQAMLKRLDQPYEYDAQGNIFWDSEQWGLADLVLTVVKLPEHSRRDFLIPWIARELVRLAKHLFDQPPTPARSPWGRIYYQAAHSLHDKSPAIAQWVKETRVDINKVDLAQALEAISTYEFKESLVEQGAVVYTFKDGWTAQELRTENALAQEGNSMQNCVGGYCEDVEKGGTRIYSIRDKAGNPHVSMELKIQQPYAFRMSGTHLSPEEFVRSPMRLGWHFEQILGKQNDRPIEKYRERAREFVDKVFDKEGFGWIVSDGTPSLGRFVGRTLIDIDITEIVRVNHLEGSPFRGADFTDANLAGCKMADLNFDGAIFSKARLAEADLSDVTAVGARFDGATCHFTDFRRADLREASLVGAHCGGAEFSHVNLEGANLRDAQVDGARFNGALGGRLAHWEGVEMTAAQREQLQLPQAPGDYKGEAARRREASLRGERA